MIIKSFCFVKAILLLLTLTFLDFLSSYYHKGQRKSIPFSIFFKKIILADFRLGCAVFLPDVQNAEIFFIFSLTLKVKRSNENQTFMQRKMRPENRAHPDRRSISNRNRSHCYCLRNYRSRRRGEGL